MGRLSLRHRGVVLNRCVAVSPRSSWAVRPLAAGAPSQVFARGLVPTSAWAVCPSAASAPSATAPTGSPVPSCPSRSSQSQQLRQRPRVKVVFFGSQEGRLPVQVLKASGLPSVSAMAVIFEGQSLPWDRSSEATSFRPSLVACHRVRSSHLRSVARSAPRLHAGLTSRCSGLPSAAAELQR
jgi:hypothetical protein